MKEDWNKDFRNLKYPSVELFVTADNVDNSELNIVLCQSVDKYPKYVIQFRKYLAFRSYPEIGSYPIESYLDESNSIALDKSTWLDQMTVARGVFGDNTDWTTSFF